MAICAGGGIEPFDPRQFGQAPAGPVADEDGNKVDGFGKQRARRGDDRLLDELLHAAERPERASGVDRTDPARMPRSEEHTSELQSLMRISYAVFCLKKKTQNNTHHTNTTHEIQPSHIK